MSQNMRQNLLKGACFCSTQQRTRRWAELIVGHQAELPNNYRHIIQSYSNRSANTQFANDRQVPIKVRRPEKRRNRNWNRVQAGSLTVPHHQLPFIHSATTTQQMPFLYSRLGLSSHLPQRAVRNYGHNVSVLPLQPSPCCSSVSSADHSIIRPRREFEETAKRISGRVLKEEE